MSVKKCRQVRSVCGRVLCQISAFLTAGVALAMLAGCSTGSNTAGNSAETGSPELAGILFLDGGKPAALARVQCVPQDFDATWDALPVAFATEADSEGYYRLDSVPPGTYSVEAFHVASGERLLVQNVKVAEGDSVAVSDTLSMPGVVDLPAAGVAEEGASGIVTALGTTIFRQVQVRDGRIVIDSLPADSLALRIFFGGDSLFLDVDVPAGDTVWLVAETDSIPMDTSAGDTVYKDTVLMTFVAPLALPTGTDTLSSFVSDIPLTLRLTAENSDFDSVVNIMSGNGGRWEVVRISADSGRSKKLPIAKMMVDTLAREAVFWVNIDSLNVADSLELSYNSSMEPAYASDVFPTNRSYSLVWHFDSGLSPVEDAAEMRYFGGTASGVTLTDGVVGKGARLDLSSTVVAENSAEADTSRKVDLVYGNDAYFCFSLWVKLESVETEQVIFDKGGEYALRYDPDRGFVVEVYHAATGNAGDGGASDTASYVATWASAKMATAQKWTYVAFSKHQSNAVADFFIDDTLVEYEFDEVAWDGKKDSARDFRVGGFAGSIDEVMLGGCFRDAAWSTLTYLNQRPENYWPALSAR